jgi:hypothetical protein
MNPQSASQNRRWQIINPKLLTTPNPESSINTLDTKFLTLNHRKNLNLITQTLNLKPYTPNPKPYTLYPETLNP